MTLMTLTQDYRHRSLQLAWATLLAAFGVFCSLLASVGYGVWYYRTHSTIAQASTLLIRAPVEWVTWQRKGHTIFEQARDGQTLSMGDRVRIASSAGYGQVATMRLFDQSTIDMWARTDLLLEELQTTRWNTLEQTVVLRQFNGYVRYDLRNDQPYQQVTFRVRVGDAWIDLVPGGSYSIEITSSNRQVRMIGQEAERLTTTNAAVRSGVAVVRVGEQVVPIAAGEQVVIDPSGNLSPPVTAIWELVRDGDFRQYTEEEYNNTTIPDQPTLPRARTWTVFSGPEESGASGFFRLSHGCPPPQKDNNCSSDERQIAAWFIRGNRQTRSFATGIYQELGSHGGGVDISEYRSLVFSAWVRILYQSVELAGERGSECPIMIRFTTKEKTPTDPERERVICVYTSDDPTQEPERAPGVTYYRAERYEWYRLHIELRDPEWLPTTRYLWRIEIYANGHDYDSRVTEVSLLGSHHAPGRATRRVTIRSPVGVCKREERVW
ncbi:MAG: hypothetical protein HC884_00430 [Chloroflexaceae bacterium]|nr:hypothetical protein [Chloroflexaceae bacterium]